MNKEKSILLVEDNPDDELLTLLAFKDNNIMNEVVVAHDGAEALDYLFGTGEFKDRDPTILPQVVLLDLKLPKIDGLEVLKEIRSNDITKLLPVVILTSSKEEMDVISSLGVDAVQGYFLFRPTPNFNLREMKDLCVAFS